MNVRAGIYFLLALVGVVGTWTYNLASIAEGRNYLGDWLNSGPSVTSLVVDILVVAVVFIVFMVVEAVRLKIHWLWIFACIATIPVVALAFSFPLFLGIREIYLLKIRAANTDQSPGTPTPHPAPPGRLLG